MIPPGLTVAFAMAPRKATLHLQRVWQGALTRQWIRRLNESAVDIQRRLGLGPGVPIGKPWEINPWESGDLMVSRWRYPSWMVFEGKSIYKWMMIAGTPFSGNLHILIFGGHENARLADLTPINSSSL